MATIHCTLEQIQKGVAVPLDERTTLVVSPPVAVATVQGRMFDSGKTFPLPRSVPALDSLFSFAVRMQHASAALVVTHVDEGTDDADALTKERASILSAWLAGDVQPWLDSYDESVAEPKRWGAREDRLMLAQMENIGTRSASPDDAQSQGGVRAQLVAAFQSARELKVDGIAGPITRKQLISDYFQLSRSARLKTDGESSDSAPAELEMTFGSHGAGASFSLDDVKKARTPDTEDSNEEESKQGTDDEAEDAPEPGTNARVDFFFFLTEVGIDPAPGSADGPEYLEWVKQAELVKNFRVGDEAAPKTQLSMQLLDKTGTIRHANQKYALAGPEEFNGVTNGVGALDHDDVSEGDYTLTLTLEFFEDENKVTDTFTSPVVVLAGDSEPQLRMLGAVPRCTLARLRGMLFETNKAFLMPTAMEDLKKIRTLYELNNPGELLVVGHTDTTGDASVNDSLSLERAKSTLAYLEDDVDTWLGFYSSTVRESRRWGSVEDAHMLGAILGKEEAATEADMDEFRSSNGIDEQGVGTETRRVLIRRYMALDGTELDSGEFQIVSKAHGCGENFPVDDTGDELDTAAEDNKEDALDRRVELFFFDAEFGIVPPPPGDNSPKGSAQYPTWRKHASLEFDSSTDEGPSAEFLLLDDDGAAMPGAHCRIEGTLAVFVADERGVVKIPLPTFVGDTLPIEWAAASSPEEFEHAVDAFVDPGTASERRLNNLGFIPEASFDSAAVQFQVREGVDDDPEPTGTIGGALPAASQARLDEIYDDAANV